MENNDKYNELIIACIKTNTFRPLNYLPKDYVSNYVDIAYCDFLPTNIKNFLIFAKDNGFILKEEKTIIEIYKILGDIFSKLKPEGKYLIDYKIGKDIYIKYEVLKNELEYSNYKIFNPLCGKINYLKIGYLIMNFSKEYLNIDCPIININVKYF